MDDFKRAFKRLAVLLAASPLSAFVLGLVVLTLGTAICEYEMITKGRSTDSYIIWMFFTAHTGVAIWLAYLWRCLDFRWLSFRGWRYRLMLFRPFWLIGFALSSFTCLYFLFVVLNMEGWYIPVDPAEFVMTTDLFMTIVRNHLSHLFYTILTNFVIVAIVSWLALSDDDYRDDLAAQMGLLN